MAARLSREAARKEALGIACCWIGTPYRHQASRKGVGCDCLGLVLGVWRELYGERITARLAYSPDWAETTIGEPLLAALRDRCDELDPAAMRPGDILAFRWQVGTAAKHLALLAPDDRIIHAYEGHAVMTSAFVPSWRRRVAGVFAFPAVRSPSRQ
ncbi:NlpC/P60 family protein [Oricola nitratireducens]|jgi:NlpC/P60 family putative phage cell wall peptidase|uniref:NlpC/P60 family protein n=1 Tax=Oricola nitratireducens TaxID=2775868 RepID=UPI001866548E|nr:NlpC/P60 family protein [Oricola nitratireducens]